MIGYSDKAVRLIVLVMPKIIEYVKTFEIKERDKYKNNKLMSFRIDYGKLLERYKAICTKIEDLKNLESNALPVYGN